ncbi:MAG: DMT family transporter [Bacteroidales bacterium]
MLQKIRHSPALPWLILALLVMIWGSSFILIKRGLEAYSSLQVGGLRVFVSFVVLLPMAVLHINKVAARKLKYIAIIGLIGTGIPAFLFARAQTHIDSSLAGILNSLTPLFTLIVGLLFFKQKSNWISMLGVLLGLLGAVGLIYVTSNGSFEFHFSFAVYVIIATILYAIQSNMIKYYLNDVNAISIASLGFFFIGIPVGIYIFFFSDFIHILLNHPKGGSSFGYVVILGVFPSAVAIIFYNKLVQITNAVFASSVTYFVPVLALAWGTFDGERFPASAFVFIALILLGVLLVNRSRKAKNLIKKSLKRFGS